MDGSTLHICHRELFCCVWRLDPAKRCRARLVFFVWSSWFRLIYWSTTSHVLIASSAQVPVSHLLLYDATRDHVFHVSSFLLVCWTDSIAGYLWCTVTDVLFAQILSTCASSTSCANWSYCTMLCIMRMRYGFAFLFGRDVTLLRCALCWTVWTLHSYRCQYWGVGAPYPWILQGMTRECHRLARGGCNQIMGLSP